MALHSSEQVSLCLIVRDEAHQLEQCLEPVASLFSEIVIVDTGSRDQTKQIASRFTPHVFDFTWCDDFSAARNAALDRVRGDWVLWLDADDRVSPENAARLGALLAGLSTEPRVYFMDTACPSQYACEGANLISHPRLFRRHPALRWRGRVHEQLRPGFAEIGHAVCWTDIQILHVGYQDAALEQRKLNRDIRLLRMDYAVDPDDIRTLVHLGLAHFRLGRWQLATEYLQRVLAISPLGEHMRQVYGALASIALREGNPSGALQILKCARLHFMDDEYLLYLQAECLYEMDRFAAARETLVQILSGNAAPQFHGGVPGQIREKLAVRKLADVLRMEHNFRGAEQLLCGLVTSFPSDSLSWYMLGQLYLDLRQQAGLHTVVGHLRNCPQGDIFASLLLAKWHLGALELATAGRLIDELIAKAPQMPLPRLLRSQWLALSNAPTVDRIRACRDVLRVQPGSVEAQQELQRLETAPQLTRPLLPVEYSTSLVFSG